MAEMLTGVTGIFVIALGGAFLLVLIVLWVLLPFAVFRMRRQLDGVRMDLAVLTDLAEDANNNLETLVRSSGAIRQRLDPFRVIYMLLLFKTP